MSQQRVSTDRGSASVQKRSKHSSPLPFPPRAHTCDVGGAGGGPGHGYLLLRRAAEALEPEPNIRPAVELVERVPHGARLRSPELRVKRAQLLELRVDRGGLGREGHERRVLGLERRYDR